MSKPLSKHEYDKIYSKVTRLTVELILIEESRVLLTKRAYEPCIGQWHIPGGTVYFGETVEEAIHRVAKEELSIQVKDLKFIDFLLYPELSAQEKIWPIGAVYQIKRVEGDIKIDFQASEYKFFEKLPDNIIEDQFNFLTKHYEVFKS